MYQVPKIRFMDNSMPFLKKNQTFLLGISKNPNPNFGYLLANTQFVTKYLYVIMIAWNKQTSRFLFVCTKTFCIIFHVGYIAHNSRIQKKCHTALKEKKCTMPLFSIKGYTYIGHLVDHKPLKSEEWWSIF